MNAKIFLLPYIENSMRGCPLVYSRYGGHTLRAERDFKIRFNNNISNKFVISFKVKTDLTKYIGIHMHIYKSYQVKVKSVQYQRKSLMLMMTLNLMLTLRFKGLI